MPFELGSRNPAGILGEVRERAINLGQIAGILEARGNLDEEM